MALGGLVGLLSLTLLPPASADAPLWWRTTKSLTRTSGPNVQIRLLVYQSQLAAITQKPLLGFGPETLDLALSPVKPARLSLYGNLKMVAGRGHNEVLELALFAGIPAALLYVAIVFLSFGVGWQRWREQRDSLMLALMIAALSGWLNHMLDVTTITGGAFFWLLLGMIVAGQPSEIIAGTPLRENWLLRLGCLVLLVGGAWLVTIRPIQADMLGRFGWRSIQLVTSIRPNASCCKRKTPICVNMPTVAY